MFFVLWGLIWLAALVFWIITIVEVVKLSDWQFRAVGSEKTNWVLVVVLAGVIGALVWRLGSKRKQVMAAGESGAVAAGPVAAAPPGWYPEPGSQSLRWWDGSQWTEHRHGPTDR